MKDQQPLYGLILMGGESSRMGQDKALLNYSGIPQYLFVKQLLESVCDKVFFSLKTIEKNLAYHLSPEEMILDILPNNGPMMGLYSAFQYQKVAWLMVAIDFPNLSSVHLSKLINARVQEVDVVAFKHQDGVLEPFATIYEPSFFPLVEESVSVGRFALCHLLKKANASIVPLDAESELLNVNTIEEYTKIKRLGGV